MKGGAGMTRAVERRVAAVRAELAARLRGKWRGVTVEESETGVVLIGRRLVRRVLADPRLTWIAGWWR